MATRLIALLRGVNVGRNKRIAMSDLRELLSRLGYADVVTHLQSGNAVFTSASGTEAGVAESIERALAEDLGIRSTVIVRTSAELDRVLTTNPLRDVVTDPARHLVGFLSTAPRPDAMRALQALDLAPDVARLVDREVFLWCPAGVRDSAFTRVAWDRLLGVAVTMRNWNTVSRLAELAS